MVFAEVPAAYEGDASITLSPKTKTAREDPSAKMCRAQPKLLRRAPLVKIVFTNGPTFFTIHRKFFGDVGSRGLDVLTPP